MDMRRRPIKSSLRWGVVEHCGVYIVAAAMRNIGDISGKYKIYMGEINDIGNIFLSLFLESP